MKRKGNLYGQIMSLDNLRLADQRAMKGKPNQPGVIEHKKHIEEDLQKLHVMFSNKTYRTSAYYRKTIREPKEREISILSYFPNRIAHHAVMNILEPVLVPCFIAQTYSCIKGRGIRRALEDVQAALKDVEATTYCLKLDIKKFYPNVNHDILKQQLRRKIKDKALLWLLDEIIDSSPGLPIGNLLSQYFGNFYLSPFDHWIKENKREARYFRYMDDMIILHHSKEHLHALLAEIRQYLAVNLKLTVKQNYQVFPVAKRGIDFVGYRIFHTHTLLRKSIKQNFARKLANNPNEKVIAAYYGWVKHCNGRHLFKTLLQKHNMKKFSELGITLNTKALLGKKVPIEDVLHEQLIIESYRIEKSIYPETGNGLCLYLQVVHNGKQRVVFTGSVYLQNLMNQTKADDLPFEATIVPVGKGYAFK